MDIYLLVNQIHPDLRLRKIIDFLAKLHFPEYSFEFCSKITQLTSLSTRDMLYDKKTLHVE